METGRDGSARQARGWTDYPPDHTVEDSEPAMTTVSARNEGCAAIHVEVARTDHRTRVTVGGELDIATAPVVERTLVEQARIGGTVVLDLRELAFIDAVGLGLLLRADARARRDGMELQLILGPRVRRLLDLCGLTPRFSYLDPQTD
jgi:anti-sigma B factor antagonist